MQQYDRVNFKDEKTKKQKHCLQAIHTCVYRYYIFSYFNILFNCLESNRIVIKTGVSEQTNCQTKVKQT